MKFKKQKRKARIILYDEEPEVFFCESCNVSAKIVKIIFSRKFNCHICDMCLEELQTKNTGDKIYPGWWK